MSAQRMKSILSLVALVGIAAATFPSPSEARTWRVEQDGSGNFTIIQDALDAAAPGDSVLIGPGRFDTMHVRNLLLNGVTAASVIWVRKPGLTLIGSGPESTVIGPPTYLGEFEGESTASLTVDAGASCEVRGMWFENTRFEVNVYASMLLEDCKVTRDPFRTDHSIFVGFCSGVTIRGMEMIDSGGINTIPGASNLLIEDCTIEDDSDWTVGIQLSNNPPNCTIRNSTLQGGAGAIQYSGTGSVEDCIMIGQTDVALSVVGSAHLIARRCFLGFTRRPVSVSSGRLELYDSLLEGGSGETIYSSGHVYVRGSHILNVGGLSVRGRASSVGEFIDLRYNWWGTSDPDQIQDWIDDRFGTVLWEPFNDMPISTEPSSVSELKGKFRRD